MSQQRPSGFTLVELLVVTAIVGVIAAIATPLLLAARASGNEASAIGSIRAINSAQTTYAAVCGGGRYSASLNTLVAEEFLSPDMGFNPKAGYNFALAVGLAAVAGPNDCVGDVTYTDFYASGVPISANSGTRGFAMNAAGTVWQDASGAAPTEPFAAAGTVSTIQ